MEGLGERIRLLSVSRKITLVGVHRTPPSLKDSLGLSFFFPSLPKPCDALRA